MTVIALPQWPYPHWIAHRGAGKLAPENTISAFRLGTQHGFRMIEFDVKVSSDGVPFLLHDDNLRRTTNAASVWGKGLSTLPSERTWNELSRLDAGSWHSRLYAGEALPTLENVAKFCLRNNINADIEIKPCPGHEERTGRIVAEYVGKLWDGANTAPLLTSFSTAALEAAHAYAPQLATGLLLENLWDGWLQFAQKINCAAVVCDSNLWNVDTVSQVHHVGKRALAYTVNTTEEVIRLSNLHVDGIITDRVDLFTPF